jgi:hypothetical protein
MVMAKTGRPWFGSFSLLSNGNFVVFCGDEFSLSVAARPRCVFASLRFCVKNKGFNAKTQRRRGAKVFLIVALTFHPLALVKMQTRQLFASWLRPSSNSHPAGGKQIGSWERWPASS